MQAFTVVIALLAVAGLGWALSAVARRILRRFGVPTDERRAVQDDEGGRQDAESGRPPSA